MHAMQRCFQSFVGRNSVITVQMRSKISKCSRNSIILPNTQNLREFEGINGTCRTLQRPANSRCYCCCDWCLLPHCQWVVFIFNFALSVRKIYHGKLKCIWQLSFFLYIIDITAKVVWFFCFAIKSKALQYKVQCRQIYSFTTLCELNSIPSQKWEQSA